MRQGISWPRSIAPFDIELVTLGKEGSEERVFADGLYGELQELGLEVLYDDRDAGPGEKFTDAELVGCPSASPSGAGRSARARSRSSSAGAGRARACCSTTRRRRSPRCGADCPDVCGAMSPNISKRRLSGFDRSGPAPEATTSGHALNPWTIPNAVDYCRLLAIPVFLIVALSSTDGHDALAVVLFGVIGWSDYLDGFRARLTGQYSRLGALLDPAGRPPADRLRDGRLLAFFAAAAVGDRGRDRAGVVHARRESLRALRGLDIQINWAGRLGVAPIAGAPFFAMAGVHWLALILLYVGMAFGLISAAMYVRRGSRELRARREDAGTDQPELSS